MIFDRALFWIFVGLIIIIAICMVFKKPLSTWLGKRIPGLARKVAPEKGTRELSDFDVFIYNESDEKIGEGIIPLKNMNRLPIYIGSAHLFGDSNEYRNDIDISFDDVNASLHHLAVDFDKDILQYYCYDCGREGNGSKNGVFLAPPANGVEKLDVKDKVPISDGLTLYIGRSKVVFKDQRLAVSRRP